MNEEKIIKLLKSSHKDDKLLGVTLAVEVLGHEWCRNHLRQNRYDSEEMILLKYNDFEIFIGPDYIEYCGKDSPNPVEKRAFHAESVIIINNKTNDTNKELSENTCKA